MLHCLCCIDGMFVTVCALVIGGGAIITTLLRHLDHGSARKKMFGKFLNRRCYFDSPNLHVAVDVFV